MKTYNMKLSSIKNRIIQFVFIFFSIATLLLTAQVHAVDVQKWKQFRSSYTNTSWSGNPFDLEFTATFTHSQSGRTFTQFGFYAGNNEWRIYFMPNEVGQWNYITKSNDSDLDGLTGTFDCVSSNLPGSLSPDGIRWKFSNGDYDYPILIPVRQWFRATSTNQGVDDFIDWAKDTVGARVIGQTLTYPSHSQESNIYVKGQEGESFYLPVWENLNSHFDEIRDANMGHYIMIYTDGGDNPNKFNIDAKSTREIRLFKYLVARFAAYPIVVWDTGIDIGEYRNNGWIDWFANWFNDNDPWQHPVSSRNGGGSGGKQPNNGTYWSDGESNLPSRNNAINTVEGRSVPTLFTDRWREDYRRGNFDRNKIRKAVWEMGLNNSTGIYISGNQEQYGYLTAPPYGTIYSQDFDAAPDVGVAANFFRSRIKNLGRLEPNDNLVTSGSAIAAADPGKEYVIYMNNENSISVNLSNSSNSFSAQWHDPINGAMSNTFYVNGGNTVSFTSPGTNSDNKNEWVLHLWSDGANNNPIPNPPTNLQIN